MGILTLQEENKLEVLGIKRYDVFLVSSNMPFTNEAKFGLLLPGSKMAAMMWSCSKYALATSQ